MLELLISPLLLVPLALPPVVYYALVERKGQPRWRSAVASQEAADTLAGPYRQGAAVVRHFDRAPALVRAAGLSSFVFGTFLLAAAPLTMLARSMVLPLLFTASSGWRLWSVGRALLLRDTGAAQATVRDATQWMLPVHGFLLVATHLCAPLMPDVEWALRAITITSLVAIVQALFVRSVARQYARPLTTE